MASDEMARGVCAGTATATATIGEGATQFEQGHIPSGDAVVADALTVAPPDFADASALSSVPAV